MESKVLDRLLLLEQLINEQNIYHKDYLSFQDACLYLKASASYLYKLTSARSIPFNVPSGKRIYFKRSELDQWILQSRKATAEEVERQGSKVVIAKFLNQKNKQ